MWTWVSALKVGVSHVRVGTHLQDSLISFTSSARGIETFVGIVSDGAGSAKCGGEGAALVVRTLSTQLRSWFRRTDELPTSEEFAYWLDQFRDRITLVATQRALDIREFAATLVCVVSTGNETVVAHVGDGCAVLRSANDGTLIAPIWPYHGEYASTTAFVTDQPVCRLVVEHVAKVVDAVIVFSDGLERLALDFRSQLPHKPFFDLVLRPLGKLDRSGRDSELSVSLKEFLDSERINSRTDDDKSLIVALRK